MRGRPRPGIRPARRLGRHDPPRRRRRPVALGPGPRRGVLEKDGSEVVGGVVLIASGENPLEVTRRIKAKVRELAPGLPEGREDRPVLRSHPLDPRRDRHGHRHDRRGDRGCVALRRPDPAPRPRVARDRADATAGRRSASFAIIGLLRVLGIAEVETNIMSLAGIAISVGVLVDSSIVMVENAMHRLRLHFGDRPVTRRRPRDRRARRASGRAADRLLGGDHAPVVPARLRARGARGEDVPAPGLHQVVRAAGVGGCSSSRSCPRSARSSSAAGCAASARARSSAA